MPVEQISGPVQTVLLRLESDVVQDLGEECKSLLNKRITGIQLWARDTYFKAYVKALNEFCVRNPMMSAEDAASRIADEMERFWKTTVAHREYLIEKEREEHLKRIAGLLQWARLNGRRR